MITAVLAGCGGAKSVDLNSVMTGINSQFGFSGLKTLEDTKALNEADVKSFAGELSTAASQYTEVVIVEAKDSNAAQNIKTQLDAHLSSQLNNAKSYDADQVAMIEACSAKTVGNYAYLVVSDKFSEITGVIEAALK